MGEAKRRGCFEERRAEAIRRNVINQEEALRQKILAQRDSMQPVKITTKSKHTMLLATLLLGSVT